MAPYMRVTTPSCAVAAAVRVSGMSAPPQTMYRIDGVRCPDDSAASSRPRRNGVEKIMKLARSSVIRRSAVAGSQMSCRTTDAPSRKGSVSAQLMPVTGDRGRIEDDVALAEPEPLDHRTVFVDESVVAVEGALGFGGGPGRIEQEADAVWIRLVQRDHRRCRGAVTDDIRVSHAVTGAEEESSPIVTTNSRSGSSAARCSAYIEQ